MQTNDTVHNEQTQPLLRPSHDASHRQRRNNRAVMALGGAIALALGSILALIAVYAQLRLERDIPISASPETLFSIIADVPNWPQWDEGLVSATLLNNATEVAPGVPGQVNMKQRGVFDFTIRDVDPQGYFTYVTQHPLSTTAVWFWEFPAIDGSDGKELHLTTGVEVSGPGAYPFKWFLGSEANSEFEKVCRNLKRLAEAKEIKSKL